MSYYIITIVISQVGCKKMFPWRVTYTMTLTLAVLNLVQGQSYNLTGSSSYGIKGGDFIFTCEILDGASLPFFLKFRKDDIITCSVDPDDCKGSPNPENSRQYKCGCINNNNRLYYMNISSLNSSHQGNWTCTNFPPTNGRSNIISLPVYNPPTITNIQSTTTNNQTNEGSRVVFSCSVDGLPVPNVTWSRSKEGQLSSSEEYNLPEASCEDTDNYTCRASNNIGLPVSTTIPLYVRCSPREKSTPVTMVRKRINSTVTLEVDIIAYPKPEFTWIFDERNEILRDKVEEMSIINYRSYLKLKLNESMFGNYTVIVNNNVGVAVNFTITVINDDLPEEGILKDEPSNEPGIEPSIWIIIGVVVVVVIVIIVVIVVCFVRRKKKKTDDNIPMVKGQGNTESTTRDAKVNDVVVNVNVAYEDSNIQLATRASGIFSTQVSEEMYAVSTKKKQKDKTSVGGKRDPMKSTINKEGLKYADVVLSNNPPKHKPRKRIEEEVVEYAGIQYGVRGPTPPPVSDSEEEDEGP